ncbi:leucyl aminopeptidase [Salaquimonas pukyongi]|uniref:leucyl aminopeptidase n=1 Tax=Salaquimonas pukyongi TaxID=2712698 RepID=UPI00096BACB9|nr:leucyl aminopeptidase [Salaquimonas pukyongi]
MAKLPGVAIAKSIGKPKGALVFFVPQDGALPPSAGPFDADGRLARAIKVAGFDGKAGALVNVLAPAAGLDRILIAGLGKPEEWNEETWLKAGGKVFAALGKTTSATIATDLDGERGALEAQEAAGIAMGATLRAYEFDAYRTKKKDEKKKVALTLVSGSDSALRKAVKQAQAIAGGVMFARDLVNEPANMLGPVEFAKKAESLKKLGCTVTVLDEKKLKTEKMGALLGVAQGSVRPARVAVIEWKGGKARDKPVAFVGKGVVFDTGGISIKPAAGMEDMKGDMGGAAAVSGVMHALAARKAKVNAVGIIGLVENMPDGNAQRPGDIVTSRSGQTIEVLNTDAEGRLVLADLLDYCEEKFQPQFMVNLATLTGAIIIALGNAHAGLFSNDDELSERLVEAGMDTRERVWRMPLDKDYDKLIDSKNADMKNIGGRMAGSITAAQFLQRFVKDTPWAHLDIAGTAMGSPKNEYSQGWSSGFGVRLLDRLVANSYE